MNRRTYVKRNIWHLGKGRKQNGGFLPLLGAVGKPLLTALAGTVGTINKACYKKNFWQGKKKEEKKKNNN